MPLSVKASENDFMKLNKNSCQNKQKHTLKCLKVTLFKIVVFELMENWLSGFKAHTYLM